MEVRLSGSLMLVSPVQSLNAHSPMEVRFSGSFISVMPIQPENAFSPIVVRLSGSLMLVSPVQPLNARFPMEVKPSGIVMRFILLSLGANPSPITFTGLPSWDSGKTTSSPLP